MRGVYPATSNQICEKLIIFDQIQSPRNFYLKGWQKPQQKCPLWFFFQLRFFFFFSWGCCFFSFAPPKNNFTIKIWWKKIAGTNSPTTIITHNHIKKKHVHPQWRFCTSPSCPPPPHFIFYKNIVVVRPQCIQTYYYSVFYNVKNIKHERTPWGMGDLSHIIWQLFLGL